MSRPSLSRLFDPRSIAVVGASGAPEKPGYQMVRAFENFPGAVYPVNPRGGEILGFEVFPTLSAIPEPVDLVAMLVPPQASADVLREASSCGAGAAFMISGGFSETGDDGSRRQAEVLEICREGGIRLLGPNTSGFMRPSRRLSCTFLPAAADLVPGNIAVVAQSGGINITMAFLAHELGLGLSLSVGLGNAADVGLAETIAYLADDEETDVIAVHLEGVEAGRTLFDTIAEVTARKPIVVLPVGQSDLGGFAESHTGNLMGAYDLTCAAMAQSGAVVVRTTTELVDAAHALSKQRLPPLESPGIGILTGQAGPGLLMTDILRSADVSVPEIGAATMERIGQLLPPLTYIRNPVDTGRPLDSFGEVCSTLAADDAVDAVLVYALHEADSVDFAAAVGDASQSSGKPFVYGTQGVAADISPLMDALEARGVASVASPDRAAAAMRALAEDSRARWRRRHPARRPGVVSGLPKLATRPDEAAAKDLLSALGIATPERLVCGNRDAAHAAREAIAGPVVVKVLDPLIAHKSESGGVHVGVRTAAQMDRALDAIDAIGAGSSNKRYLVEEMAPPGLEVIVGARNDPSWGPVVLLGLGGTVAEALGDVAMRLAPIDPAEALAMMSALRGRVLFEGFRNMPAVDKAALAELVCAVGELVCARPEIREIDLNPVRVYTEGVVALDALIVT